MPELPEVETTLRGIAPHLLGRRIACAKIHNPSLRWPVPGALPEQLQGRKISCLARRGKYLLVTFAHGHLLMHLGMSGSLRIVEKRLPPGKHDHLDIHITGGGVLRFNDPRRFGTVLWIEGDPADHWLLRHLGPEPLGGDFSGAYLYRKSRGRKGPIKNFLMDSRVVVGVGNIYANEALFLSGIRPSRAAGRISLDRYEMLAHHVRRVLESAIRQGGTTLRDFVGADGNPGYFRQTLQVYGRGGEPCRRCGTLLREIRIAQRSTVYCPRCQGY